MTARAATDAWPKPMAYLEAEPCGQGDKEARKRLRVSHVYPNAAAVACGMRIRPGRPVPMTSVAHRCFQKLGGTGIIPSDTQIKLESDESLSDWICSEGIRHQAHTIHVCAEARYEQEQVRVYAFLSGAC